MKDYNEEYFFFKMKDSNIPILEYTGSTPIAHEGLFYSDEAIDSPDIIPLKYSFLIVKEPQLADVHFIGFNFVVSERLKEHLEKLNLMNIQFIPATIQDYGDEVHTGYYILHVHNLIRCADLEKSEWSSPRRNPDQVLSFDKLVLDNEALDKIPLEDRLIIALEEENLTHLYHRSVVDHILQLRPTGVTFFRLAGYTGREPFDDEFLDFLSE